MRDHVGLQLRSLRHFENSVTNGLNFQSVQSHRTDCLPWDQTTVIAENFIESNRILKFVSRALSASGNSNNGSISFSPLETVFLSALRLLRLSSLFRWFWPCIWTNMQAWAEKFTYTIGPQSYEQPNMTCEGNRLGSLTWYQIRHLYIDVSQGLDATGAAVGISPMNLQPIHTSRFLIPRFHYIDWQEDGLFRRSPEGHRE